MIRSQLISKLNLLRTYDLILLNQRCLQRSALCCGKPVKKRYRAPTEVADQRIEEAHFQKNDSLLDLDRVLAGQASERKQKRNQTKFAPKPAKPRYDRERNEDDRMSSARMPEDSKTDPAIRSLFM